MSLTAVMNNGDVVSSPEMMNADRKKKYYFCRNCLCEMRLKISKNRINHFAHMPNASCGLAGESMLHMEAKNYIYNVYKNDKHYRTVEMEHRLWSDERIGDVVLYPENTDILPTVIEIQNSSMTADEIDARFDDWNGAGHAMLWIITDKVIHTERDRDNEKSVPKWVRHLHKIYMGRVYVYSGNNVHVVHLDSVSRYNDYMDYEYFLKATKTVDSRIVDSKNLLQATSKDRQNGGEFMISRFYDKKFWNTRKEA